MPRQYLSHARPVRVAIGASPGSARPGSAVCRFDQSTDLNENRCVEGTHPAGIPPWGIYSGRTGLLPRPECDSCDQPLVSGQSDLQSRCKPLLVAH